MADELTYPDAGRSVPPAADGLLSAPDGRRGAPAPAGPAPALPAPPFAGERFRPLRQEVHWLGELLGEVLREQGGSRLLEAVERVRLATRRLREAWDPELDRSLTSFLAGLPDDLAVQVARAFGLYFLVTNLAEQHHRVRRRRAYRQDHDRPQPASLPALVAELKERGLDSAQVLELLGSLEIQLVWTAHPTEASRRTVLGILRDLYELLELRERASGDLAQQEEIRERVHELLTLLWQTSEVRSRRPDPMDELRRVLFFFDGTLFDALPRLFESLERELALAFPDIRRLRASGRRLPGPLVQLRSWVGGDRDGNPSVTAAVTWEAACRQRDLAVRRYMHAVRGLMARFGQSSRLTPVSRELLRSVEEDEARYAPQPLGFIRWNDDEPYRRKLAVMYWRLELLRRHNLELQRRWPSLEPAPPGQEGRYRSAAELLEDLRLLERSLLAGRGETIALGSLGRLIRQVEAFGFHLAPIEVRQHSDVHAQTVAEILDRAGIEPVYEGLDEQARQRVLVRLLGQLARKTPGPWTGPSIDRDALSPVAQEVLRTFHAIRAARREIGPGSIDTYLVSMVHRPSDVLEVLLLAEWTGAHRIGPDERWSPLRVVPIVETIEDLGRSAAIVHSLASLPAMRPYLEAWGGLLEVMLGYSDSSKDGGYLAANWALYRAQQEMLRIAGPARIRIRFFHGRGGTLGRGGGPTTRAILALPPGATLCGIKLTEQGEVLSERYLIPDLALRSLEQVVWAAAHKALADRGRPDGGAGDEPPARRWHALMERMAQRSLEAYRELLFGDGQAGLRYFFAATPIEHIGRLNIGSRPESRGVGQRFEELRAIPWVFAWNQSRHLLPAWYGTGTAFETMIQEEGVESLTEMYERWPFFRALVDNLQMALAKADMRIAARYAALAGPGAAGVFGRIESEYRRTREWVLRITRQQDLLEREPHLRDSIRLRNPYVDALSYLQVMFLERWRSPGPRRQGHEDLLFGILVTINGIAAGLRNTG
ncbi:phosphoenolpyruvate carboxylase [Carboxydochorda subterranea]|uniref:Phosphoenolpyruvate carboxylase n=1 Tax=Carboxydichorda subterranea TaxID=3109565 RepID=A0ABZ1BY22_9FIRM|nr:phosphoenolpyruvate carboxylase [Limnochorda sp. L945t]WRP17594.1 phosphoenolpyruvate carboxylase [Limnochorda sp. L945t]